MIFFPKICTLHNTVQTFVDREIFYESRPEGRGYTEESPDLMRHVDITLMWILAILKK